MNSLKKLRGLPGNLALSYLSTLNHYNGGYMADWINLIAREKSLTEIQINILEFSVYPLEATHTALLYNIDKLKKIIYKELESNNLKKDSIVKAILKFEIPLDSEKDKNWIYCHPYIIDRNEKIYKPNKRIIELAHNFI